ncbi:MAG: Glu/Leu/Phe/Val dehydrogenase dimerization domain-containing protein [Candidatus Vogelbacteria bacterium]
MLNTRELTITDLSKNTAYKNHVAVISFEDDTCSLSGFIAIHNEKLGIAVGGTRVYSYASKEDALTDVLRLSETMTYKCAIAGVAHGGGKAVIIGDPKKIKTPELLKSYAEVIKSLKGRFYTGEDVGLSESDVQYMLKFSPYFIGKSDQAGDPSEYASLSVFVVMQEAVKKVLRKDSLKGVRVGVKGLGKVGYGLVKLLSEAGAIILGADIDTLACERVRKNYPEVAIVPPENILSEKLDVYAPCAMGNEFTSTTIQKISLPKIICGGANNQLSSASIANELQKNGVLYVPDYLANAGGLINVADELEEGGYNQKRVLNRIEKLRVTFNMLYDKALENGICLNDATDAFCDKLINYD